MIMMMTLKTKDESPSPMVAMRPPSTDVALSPILRNSGLEKEQEKKREQETCLKECPRKRKSGRRSQLRETQQLLRRKKAPTQKNNPILHTKKI